MERVVDEGVTRERQAVPAESNRGYQQLRVWEDAIELYKLTCGIVRGWSFELKRVAGQAIASADSVHRNIAEGYCRRSIKEYIQFLYVALASLGESVSGYIAFREAGQITPEQFEALDGLAYQTENKLGPSKQQLSQPFRIENRRLHGWPRIFRIVRSKTDTYP